MHFWTVNLADIFAEEMTTEILNLLLAFSIEKMFYFELMEKLQEKVKK